jgi:D-glycero-alpha-D-manno-heptose-7-phosphate kinase
MSRKISNPHIDEVAGLLLSSGAHAIKVSGAGGGGFMMIFIDPDQRLEVEATMRPLGGYFQRFQFTHSGAESWKV